VLEVSLGYFINPLMHIAVGVFVLNERFGRWRALAVGLAALGVLNQVITVGEPPILALFLAVSFTAYAYMRKTIAVDGRIGLFWETVLIAIPSLPAIIFLEYERRRAFLRRLAVRRCCSS
jgi:chloramphenicol-sensitive protein RarD